MAKKRKALTGTRTKARFSNNSPFESENPFDDSEDEFFEGRDKILLHEEPATKRLRRLQQEEIDLQPSDEEVFQNTISDAESLSDLDIGSLDGAEDDAIPGENEHDDEMDNRYWGPARGDYYNADAIETEADALEEEAEAKRLHQKQLKSMTEADFGFEESSWHESSQPGATGKRPGVEKLPTVGIPENATRNERLQMLKSRYPEFRPLTDDFLELQDTSTALKKSVLTVSEGTSTVTLTKLLALSAYMGSIAMYLAIMSSPKSGQALSPADLHEHPIMATIVRCRKLWLDAQNLKVDRDMPESDHGPFSVEQLQLPENTPLPLNTVRRKAMAKRTPPSPNLNTLESTATMDKPRKPHNVKRNDLQTLLAASLKKPVDQESDFGDEAPLTHAEAEEKARRKKSLRFYTSQIVQKANRRGLASRHAGGDDDIPHKERQQDRHDRLLREAEQRGVAGGADLENSDTDEEVLRDVRQNHTESNDFYNSLVTNSKQKMAEKQIKARAYAEAASLGAQVFEEEQLGIDGKRKITYAIEKNKGLAPKRKKDVRNPRVKKRKKYDEKMKKLSSIRQVYKGGEGRGGYGGEATGIKTNLVKSTKL